MAEYKMTAKELILTSGSSRGSQMKFLKDGYWYKIDETGPEGKAEEVASDILSFSSLRPEEYVRYESCRVSYGGKTYDGCRSKSFVREGEQLYSFEHIYELVSGGSLAERITPMGTPEERIRYVADLVRDFSGLDVRGYIAKNLTADMLLLNTDRHFNNLGIIADLNDYSFRIAPIYDNGASFLSNYNAYPPSLSVREVADGSVSVTGKPFAASLEYQASAAGFGIRFDFGAIRAYLETMEDGRMKDLLSCQVDRYGSVAELTALPG